MLKYKVNILDELKKAGYSTYRIRKERLIGEATAQKLREQSTSVNLETMGIVCDLLQCQPGDLVEWVPNEPADGQHPSCKHRLVEPGGSNGSPESGVER